MEFSVLWDIQSTLSSVASKKRDWSPKKPLKPKEQEIVRILGAIVEADGFRLAPRQRMLFSRSPAPGVVDFLSLQFTHYREYTLAEMLATKRFAAACELRYGQRDPDGVVSTIGKRVGRLSGEDVAWRFRDDDDVREFQPSLADAYRRLALPFFEQYASSAKAFDEASADLESSNRLMRNSWLMNSIMLLAWAVSLDRRDDFDRLVRERRAILTDSDYPEFDREVKRLRKAAGW